MTSVVLLLLTVAVQEVTTGVTVATCTAAPLLTPLVVTEALRRGRGRRRGQLHLQQRRVCPITVPAAPSLNVTVLLPGVGSKLEPKR